MKQFLESYVRDERATESKVVYESIGSTQPFPSALTQHLT